MKLAALVGEEVGELEEPEVVVAALEMVVGAPAMAASAIGVPA